MYVFLSQMRSRICWEEPDLLPHQQTLAQDTTTTLDDEDDEPGVEDEDEALLELLGVAEEVGVWE